MAIEYKAFVGGKEIDSFYSGGKEIQEIWGGDTLLWKKNEQEGFQFTWSGNLAIRIWGKVNVLAGDGTTYALDGENGNGDGSGLLYRKNDGKVYTATITGCLKDIYFSNKTVSDSLTYRCDVIDVLTPFPKTMENVIDFTSHAGIKTGLFQDCLKLRSVHKNLLANIPKLKSAYCMFMNTSLKSIPQSLFWENKEIESFHDTFYNTKIKSIPSGLFEKNKKAVSFVQCFAECVQLSGIPARLFAGLNKVETFFGCFRWYYFTGNGTSAPIPQRILPSDLFEECVSAKDFSYCFASNAGVTSVPENLFDDCPAEDFTDCFHVGQWSSAKPTQYATLVSAPKFWEKFPNATGKGCFDGQYYLPWYYSTPASWRENERMYRRISL